MNNFHTVKFGILRASLTKAQNRYTRIVIRYSWLAEAGFFHGASVCAVPMSDGFTISLQTSKNAGLGKTFRVGFGDKYPRLTFDITPNFPIPEISGGDFLAAAYEHGRIAAKKLPPADKYYLIDTQNYAAHLRLYGAWLIDAGFPPDTIATVAAERGKITINARTNTSDYDDINSRANYGEIVKYARGRKLQLAQTKKHEKASTLDLFDRTLENAGFATGDICGVRCHETGKISLFKPDLTTTVANLPTDCF
jgi:hypothetical protein